jgi:hypothetical protein
LLEKCWIKGEGGSGSGGVVNASKSTFGSYLDGRELKVVGGSELTFGERWWWWRPRTCRNSLTCAGVVHGRREECGANVSTLRLGRVWTRRRCGNVVTDKKKL